MISKKTAGIRFLLCGQDKAHRADITKLEQGDSFTRPRRFGKTLNMSMLKSFFEIGTDKSAVRWSVYFGE